MKNIEKEEYLEHSQFNLTKLIKKNYEAGTPLTKEFLEGVDFNEEASKLIFLPIGAEYHKQSRYDIKETLATNLSASLPLEYYKQYIEPSWIISNSYNEHIIIHRALDDNNYDFLYEMISVCKKHLSTLDKNEVDTHRKFLNAYENSLLSPILDIGRNLEQFGNLNRSQSVYDDYYKLFKVALKEFKDYYENHSNKGLVFPENKRVFDDQSWFLEYRKMEVSFRRFGKEEEILSLVIKNPKAFSVYLDIFSQHKDTEVNPFLSDEVFYNAFSAANKKVVAHLCKEMPFNAKEVNKNFINVMQDWVENQADKFSDAYSVELGDASSYIRSLIDIAQKNNPGHTLENKQEYELFSHVLPAINKKLADDILIKYPKLAEEELYLDLTLKEWRYARDLFSEFMTNQNLKMIESKNGANYPSYEAYYLIKATNHMSPVSDVNEKSKLAVNEIIAQYFLPLLDANWDYAERATAFYAFTLSKSMEDKKEDKKRLKL